MIDRTAEQINDLLERQDAHEQRLRVLMLQSAKFGRSTPAEIQTEVREIQTEVLNIALQISKLQINANKAEHRQIIATNTEDLADVSLQISSSTDAIRRFQQTILAQLVDWTDGDKNERARRQRITNIFYLTVVVMLAIDILVRLFR